MEQNDFQIFNRLFDFLLETEINEPVAKPIDSKKVMQQLNLNLSSHSTEDLSLESYLKDIISATPKTASTKFFNQLFGGRNSKATLGELLSVLLNNSMYTYKVAGPQVGIEKAIIEEVIRIINYPKESIGTFAAGGSLTNMMAMIMARDKADETIKNEGVRKRLIAYTSESAHYSISKNAALIGIGTENVRHIKNNEKGEIDIRSLEIAIVEDLNKGYIPFFVNSTAGTTVLGAFDNILKVHSVCKKYSVWLHVDGAYCGAVIFSKTYKHLINGLEFSDSFSFNAHKMLGTPLSCSLIITKHKTQMHNSFSKDADYLYQTDDDNFNLGKISLQCGRRNDALKFWTLWKSVGTNGLETIVDKQFELANYAIDYIKQNKDYTLYSYDNSISICFNYKDIAPDVLCTSLYEHSKLMVGFGEFNNNKFVRMVTINSILNKEDIDDFFKTLEHHANTALLKTI